MFGVRLNGVGILLCLTDSDARSLQTELSSAEWASVASTLISGLTRRFGIANLLSLCTEWYKLHHFSTQTCKFVSWNLDGHIPQCCVISLLLVEGLVAFTD
jgi:hypothetical protein